MKKTELLAPAGDLEKLKTAVDYGADAVYFGGEAFSLRAGAGNLSIEEMREGIEYAHEKNVRCYLTVNIFAHNDDIAPLEEYFESIKDLGIDAYLISDPGVFSLIRKHMPGCEIHLSTQANMTNYETAMFWYGLGVKRIVLARELSFREISELREKCPEDLEFEAFVHGAMCISYSGRCLLSNFMINRDANHGECAHPCRWKYALMEEQRPGDYYPIEEDERGTYILNSKDLCMIRHIPELITSGLSSLKIEGRMKSAFYVAHVVSAYRKAIDAYYEDPEGYEFNEEWMDELLKVSHRQFTTGFYFDKPTDKDQNYETSQYTRDYIYTGVVKDYDPETRMAVIEQRNKMVLGDEIEVFGPFTDFFIQKVSEMFNEEGTPIDSCPHPQEIIRMRMEGEVKPGWMLRKKK